MNPEKLSPSLVISTFRRFARTPPVAEKTGQQLTDYRVIEKKRGLRQKSSFHKAQLIAPLTQKEAPSSKSSRGQIRELQFFSLSFDLNGFRAEYYQHLSHGLEPQRGRKGLESHYTFFFKKKKTRQDTTSYKRLFKQGKN